MFKRGPEGNSVTVSLRMTDGAMLIGAINCGATGKIENFLSSDIKFVEFVSKEGQQRFIAHHQIASVEPLASLEEPSLPEINENLEPFGVFGLKPAATMEEAMAAFQAILNTYNAERWTGAGIPFEFSRFAAQKSRQIHAAFTAVKGEILAREERERLEKAKAAEAAPPRPLFGARLQTG
jgi:DnaJ-domain-containing protein 1